MYFGTNESGHKITTVLAPTSDAALDFYRSVLGGAKYNGPGQQYTDEPYIDGRCVAGKSYTVYQSWGTDI